MATGRRIGIIAPIPSIFDLNFNRERTDTPSIDAGAMIGIAAIGYIGMGEDVRLRRVIPWGKWEGKLILTITPINPDITQRNLLLIGAGREFDTDISAPPGDRNGGR